MSTEPKWYETSRRHGNVILEATDAVVANPDAHYDPTTTRGVFVHVDVAQAHHIPALHAAGFGFHHAAPNAGVMMSKWISSEPNSLPSYATAKLGAGAVVVHPSRGVLLVRERNGPPKWKIPGGYVELGETPARAAVREVCEETGLRVSIMGMIGMRCTTNVLYGVDDVYTVYTCKMFNTSAEPVANPDELADACFMNVPEALASDDVSDITKYWLRNMDTVFTPKANEATYA